MVWCFGVYKFSSIFSKHAAVYSILQVKSDTNLLNHFSKSNKSCIIPKKTSFLSDNRHRSKHPIWLVINIRDIRQAPLWIAGNIESDLWYYYDETVGRWVQYFCLSTLFKSFVEVLNICVCLSHDFIVWA